MLFQLCKAVEQKVGYIKDAILSALGFCNWKKKKAVQNFSKHERSACHHNALINDHSC